MAEKKVLPPKRTQDSVKHVFPALNAEADALATQASGVGAHGMDGRISTATDVALPFVALTCGMFWCRLLCASQKKVS